MRLAGLPLVCGVFVLFVVVLLLCVCMVKLSLTGESVGDVSELPLRVRLIRVLVAVIQ